jgi:hypothetical protein
MLPEPRGRTRPALGRASWQRTRRAVLERDGWACQYCGATATLVDHVIPADLWGGAHDDPTNLKAAGSSCNNLSLPSKQRKLGERNPSLLRQEREGATGRPYTFAHHRCGGALLGFIYPGQPLLEECPPDCPRRAA